MPLLKVFISSSEAYWCAPWDSDPIEDQGGCIWRQFHKNSLEKHFDFIFQKKKMLLQDLKLHFHSCVQ